MRRRGGIAVDAVTDEFDVVIICAGPGVRIVSVTTDTGPATPIGDTYVVQGQYRNAEAVEAAIVAEWS